MPSRLLNLVAVELMLVPATLTRPLPDTHADTLKLYQLPPVIGPEEAMIAPTGGWVSNVMLSSPQVLSDTPRTSTPIELLVSANILSVADWTTPTTCTSKRAKTFRTGDASVLSAVDPPLFWVGDAALTQASATAVNVHADEQGPGVGAGVGVGVGVPLGYWVLVPASLMSPLPLF